MKAARSSQKLVTLYEATRHCILDDCNIFQRHSENLNSHKCRLSRISQFVTSLPNLKEIISIVSDMKHADGLYSMTLLLCLVLNIKSMCGLQPCKRMLARNGCSYIDPIVRPSVRPSAHPSYLISF
jgi:hypothetical protein